MRLVKILRSDTSSWTCASMEGWPFPIERGDLATLDLFDVTVLANSDSKKGKPRPHSGRPFKVNDRQERKYGDTGGRSRAQVVAILNEMGHNLPV